MMRANGQIHLLLSSFLFVACSANPEIDEVKINFKGTGKKYIEYISRRIPYMGGDYSSFLKIMQRPKF